MPREFGARRSRLFYLDEVLISVDELHRAYILCTRERQCWKERGRRKMNGERSREVEGMERKREREITKERKVKGEMENEGEKNLYRLH